MKTINRLSATALLLAAPFAFGSTGHQMDAANPQAMVPAVPYESVLTGYISRQVNELTAWKEANASAGGGGHAGHGSHMVQPDTSGTHEGHDMGQAMPEPPAEKTNPQAGHQH